jgi:hypothetical protein
MGQSTSLSTLTMAGLRDERTRCRQALELARLRSRHEGVPTAEAVAGLRARADALTEELIRRYAADLGLVDSLLEPAYSRSVRMEPGSVEGGAAR